jgi:hypothetical protein
VDRAPTELRLGRARPGTAQRQLLVDGHAAALGARAFDPLLFLLEPCDPAAGKAELLDLIWPGRVVAENNLQVQIIARRKLTARSAGDQHDSRARLPLHGGARRRRGCRRCGDTAAATVLAAVAAGNLSSHLPQAIGGDADLTATNVASAIAVRLQATSAGSCIAAVCSRNSRIFCSQ